MKEKIQEDSRDPSQTPSIADLIRKAVKKDKQSKIFLIVLQVYKPNETITNGFYLT